MKAESLRIFDPETGVTYRPVDAFLRPGDICACLGTDPASRLISYGTASINPFPQRRLRLSPSHVAMICRNTRRLDAGDSIWLESTTFCNHKCLIRAARGHESDLGDP